MSVKLFLGFCLFHWVCCISPGLASTLIIGDSHLSGAKNLNGAADAKSKCGFGVRLQNLVSNLDRDTHSFGSCGSYPATWITGKVTPCGMLEIEPAKDPVWNDSLATPKLANILKPQTDWLIVQQGTNFLPMYNGITSLDDKKRLDVADNFVKASVRSIIDQFHGKKCIWIGPPKAMTSLAILVQDHLSEVIQKASEPRCHYVNSLKYTEYNVSFPDKMKMHYPCAEGEKWAQKIFDIEVAPYLKANPVSLPKNQIPAAVR